MKQRNIPLLLSSGVVLTATFLIVAALMNVGQNAFRLLTQWGEHVQIAVYLDADIDRSTVSVIERKLAEIAPKSEIAFINAQDAARLFKNQMAGFAPDLLEDAEFATPFPEHFTLKLSQAGSVADRPDELESLAKSIDEIEGVNEVSYGQSWIKDYSSVFAVIRVLAFLLAAVLVLASTLIVSNAVRALVYHRSSEIELMELIGATDEMIRRPFYSRALALVGLSLVVALLMNFAIHLWLKDLMSKSLALARLSDDLVFLGPVAAAALLILALGTGVIGTWLSLRSLNTGWSAAESGQSPQRGSIAW